MQNLQLKGTELTLTPSNFSVSFSILFPSESLLQYFAEVDPDQVIEVVIRKGVTKVRRPKTLPQHRKWFVTIHEILLHHKKEDDPYAKITAKELNDFHYEMKKQFFPCAPIMIGPIQIPGVPSINDLSVEELSDALSNLIDTYDYITFIQEPV